MPYIPRPEEPGRPPCPHSQSPLARLVEELVNCSTEGKLNRIRDERLAEWYKDDSADVS